MARRGFFHWAGGVAIVAALASCAPSDSSGPATAEDVSALIATARADALDLQPGEKLHVTVFGEDRLTGDYQIDPGGDLSLPLAGAVKAAGISKRDLEASLARKLRGEYLRDPKVTIEVTDFKPFYILGEVAKPGEYPFKGGLDVMSALALAGGATYRASRNQRTTSPARLRGLIGRKRFSSSTAAARTARWKSCGASGRRAC